MAAITFSALVERVTTLAQEVHDLQDEIKTLRRALYTVAMTVSGSAIVFAFTVLHR